MDVVTIHTTGLKQKSNTKYNQTASEKTRQIHVVKTLNAFIFQLHDKKFAIDLSCIVCSGRNYAEIHKFDDKTPYIIGFTFINNELVKILNLMEIVSISKRTNNSAIQRLLEIEYGNTRVGILVDDMDFETKILQITDEHVHNVNLNANQFKCLDAVIFWANEEIFLLNEKNLFNEIQMKINYNETT